ncbi:hypothetical protein Tcan_08933 [Toxocara canis]|uniref:Uncharacterized protein n=1 Tax=Toxocara canis TaxID=6265 RepID=A0A0B2W1J0_TOXCA|nr:hypothetical protein Tcan_08933 [Toxocara canis]
MAAADKLRNKEAKAKKMQMDAVRRLRELRKAARMETSLGSSTDEIVFVKGGGELHCVTTPTTRAYYLKQGDSWLYLERDNDGESGILHVVRRFSDGRITTKTVIG